MTNPATTYLSQWPEKSDTRRSMRQSLRALARRLTNDQTLQGAETFPWHELRWERAMAIPSQLIDEGLSVATVRRCVVALRGVLEVAWRAGLIPSEEYQKIDFPPVRGKSVPAGRALSDAERRAAAEAIRALPPRDAALLALLSACGIRRIEAVRLRREDYDPEDGQVRVRGKGGKPRLVPVDEEWRPVVEAHWKTLPARAPMFASDRGPLTRSGVTFLVEQFCRSSGVKRFTPHDLRRTFGTALLDAGADVLTVKDLMGHESADTTKIYDRRGDAAKVRAVAAIRAPRVPREPAP